MHCFSKAAAALAASLSMVAGATHGAELVQSFTLNVPETYGGVTTPWVLAQLDPSVGAITGISVKLTVDLDRIEHYGPNPDNVPGFIYSWVELDALLSRTFDITGPDDQGFIYIEAICANSQAFLPVTEATVVDASCHQSVSDTPYPVMDFRAFTGNLFMAIDLRTRLSIYSEHTAPLLYLEGAGPVVTATVTYTYTPSAAPEPGTWALLIGGFGAVGATLRRRQLRTA